MQFDDWFNEWQIKTGKNTFARPKIKKITVRSKLLQKY